MINSIAETIGFGVIGVVVVCIAFFSVLVSWKAIDITIKRIKQRKDPIDVLRKLPPECVTFKVITKSEFHNSRIVEVRARNLKGKWETHRKDFPTASSAKLFIDLFFAKEETASDYNPHLKENE